MERAFILETLEDCAWNITRAAGILGINRVTLHKKIDRFKLKAYKK
jgi:transcriptional regulator of acetoin/glycerol metabolism